MNLWVGLETRSEYLLSDPGDQFDTIWEIILTGIKCRKKLGDPSDPKSDG